MVSKPGMAVGSFQCQVTVKARANPRDEPEHSWAFRKGRILHGGIAGKGQSKGFYQKKKKAVGL